MQIATRPVAFVLRVETRSCLLSLFQGSLNVSSTIIPQVHMGKPIFFQQACALSERVFFFNPEGMILKWRLGQNCIHKQSLFFSEKQLKQPQTYLQLILVPEMYLCVSWCPSSSLGTPIPEAPASDRLKLMRSLSHLGKNFT